MPVLWIVDDEQAERQRAQEVVQEVLRAAHPPLKAVQWDRRLGRKAASPTNCLLIVEWDGGWLDKAAPPADFVILDLDLRLHAALGLERVHVIPGVQPDRLYGPFIIIWSHFDGDYPLGTFLQAQKSDRVVRTYWKSATNLKERLQGFVQRFRDEGVSHAAQNS